eukprot:scaffold5366_cov128-Isochrysis_galbana.AAC.6
MIEKDIKPKKNVRLPPSPGERGERRPRLPCDSKKMISPTPCTPAQKSVAHAARLWPALSEANGTKNQRADAPPPSKEIAGTTSSLVLAARCRVVRSERGHAQRHRAQKQHGASERCEAQPARIEAVRRLGVGIRGVAAELIGQAADSAHTTNVVAKSPEGHPKRLV